VEVLRELLEVLELGVVEVAAVLREPLGEVDVVHDVEVEVAVAVVVEEGRPAPPARVAHAGRRGDVGEVERSVVAQEDVGAEARDEEVEVAVTVVVARDRAERPAVEPGP
jgi:hypothetical protein